MRFQWYSFAVAVFLLIPTATAELTGNQDTVINQALKGLKDSGFEVGNELPNGSTHRVSNVRRDGNNNVRSVEIRINVGSDGKLLPTFNSIDEARAEVKRTGELLEPPKFVVTVRVSLFNDGTALSFVTVDDINTATTSEASASEITGGPKDIVGTVKQALDKAHAVDGAFQVDKFADQTFAEPTNTRTGSRNDEGNSQIPDIAAQARAKLKDQADQQLAQELAGEIRAQEQAENQRVADAMNQMVQNSSDSFVGGSSNFGDSFGATATKAFQESLPTNSSGIGELAAFDHSPIDRGTGNGGTFNAGGFELGFQDDPTNSDPVILAFGDGLRDISTAGGTNDESGGDGGSIFIGGNSGEPDDGDVSVSGALVASGGFARDDGADPGNAGDGGQVTLDTGGISDNSQEVIRADGSVQGTNTSGPVQVSSSQILSTLGGPSDPVLVVSTPVSDSTPTPSTPTPTPTTQTPPATPPVVIRGNFDIGFGSNDIFHLGGTGSIPSTSQTFTPTTFFCINTGVTGSGSIPGAATEISGTLVDSGGTITVNSATVHVDGLTPSTFTECTISGTSP